MSFDVTAFSPSYLPAFVGPRVSGNSNILTTTNKSKIVCSWTEEVDYDKEPEYFPPIYEFAGHCRASQWSTKHLVDSSHVSGHDEDADHSSLNSVPFIVVCILPFTDDDLLRIPCSRALLMPFSRQ
jgi:hypothetical protein